MDNENANNEHGEIKKLIKMMITHIHNIRKHLDIKGVEYDIHIEVVDDKVEGGIRYGGLKMDEKGRPEVVELMFDDGKPIQPPDLSKPKTNEQLVDEMLKEMLK